MSASCACRCVSGLARYSLPRSHCGAVRAGGVDNKMAHTCAASPCMAAALRHTREALSLAGLSRSPLRPAFMAVTS